MVSTECHWFILRGMFKCVGAITMRFLGEVSRYYWPEWINILHFTLQWLPGTGYEIDSSDRLHIVKHGGQREWQQSLLRVVCLITQEKKPILLPEGWKKTWTKKYLIIFYHASKHKEFKDIYEMKHKRNLLTVISTNVIKCPLSIGYINEVGTEPCLHSTTALRLLQRKICFIYEAQSLLVFCFKATGAGQATESLFWGKYERTFQCPL